MTSSPHHVITNQLDILIGVCIYIEMGEINVHMNVLSPDVYSVTDDGHDDDDFIMSPRLFPNLTIAKIIKINTNALKMLAVLFFSRYSTNAI